MDDVKKKGMLPREFQIYISKLLWIKSNAAQISIAYDQKKKKDYFYFFKTHSNQLEILFRKDRDSSLFKNVKS